MRTHRGLVALGALGLSLVLIFVGGSILGWVGLAIFVAWVLYYWWWRSVADLLDLADGLWGKLAILAVLALLTSALLVGGTTGFLVVVGSATAVVLLLLLVLRRSRKRRDSRP